MRRLRHIPGGKTDMKAKELLKAVAVTLVTMVVINNGVKYLPASVQKIVTGG